MQRDEGGKQTADQMRSGKQCDDKPFASHAQMEETSRYDTEQKILSTI